jgi:thioesterase domain-containing protein
MTPTELTTALHTLIPLTAAMGASVTHLDPEALTLTAPLSANHNHAGSAFAGSLYALASVAGWAFLHQLLQREKVQAELVLADGHVRYRQPVWHALQAQLHVPSAEQRLFLQRLQQGRRARLRLDIALPDQDTDAASFQGLYIATPHASTNRLPADRLQPGHTRTLI